jgi:D-glucosaminate-6-phosphate ammonia-lyase
MDLVADLNNMNVYESLGVTRVINALGPFTRLGGSLMPVEVLQSMQEAARNFVCMEDLQHAAGTFISRLTHSDAAYVTSGAQAAIVLSVAACITGLDAEKMNRLPQTSGLRNEVVMARLHRNHYDHAVEAAGGRIVEAGGDHDCPLDALSSRINASTAAILYLPGKEDQLNLPEVVAVARRHGVSVIVDAAGCCDEPRNLTRFVQQGGDLVCFSGGKYIRGPQSSGFVCGRRQLISAIAWQHLDMDFTPAVWTAPPELLCADDLEFIPRQGIGRGYKAGKEEIVGLLTALRLYFDRDHSAEKQNCLNKLESIACGLFDVKQIKFDIVPADPNRGGFARGRLSIDWDLLGLSCVDFIRALKQGSPSIHPGETELDRGSIVFHPFGLQDGDEQAIVHRVKEIVKTASGKVPS